MATNPETNPTEDEILAAAADAAPQIDEAAKAIAKERTARKAKPAGAHADAPKPRGRRKAAAKPAAPKERTLTSSSPAKRVSGRDAVRKVLADGKPQKAGDITAAAVKLIRPKPAGKTPEATVGALLYVQAKKDDGFVIRTGTGEFKLR